MYRLLPTLSAATVTLLLILPPMLWAQQKSADAPASTARSWKLGTELDVVPYATGGYYASFFGADKGWRLRAVVARSGTPSFLVSSGFEKKRTDAYALLVDRFLGAHRAEFKGFWVGSGVEYWHSRIRQANTNDFTHYDNVLVTAGGGYVWRIKKYFYLNPWVDTNFVVGGSRDINVSGKVYTQPLVTPEVSLKLGFIF